MNSIHFRSGKSTPFVPRPWRVAVALGIVLVANAAAELPPAIEWQRVLGGTGGDSPSTGRHAVTPVADGGFLVAAVSNSAPSGNKTSVRYGDFDLWVIQIDAGGNPVWDRSFGGTSYETNANIALATDGSYFLGGYSTSGVSGNKTSPNRGNSAEDFWLVKADASGNKLWDRTFGGTNHDWFQDMALDGNGGVLMFGSSESGVSGNKTSISYSTGGNDFWLITVDENGNKVLDQSYGGSANDYGASITRTDDGGAMLAGRSLSGVSGNKTSPPLGQTDAWLVKVDGGGNKVWDRAFGGSDVDAFSDILPTSDGGFLVAGESNSGPAANKVSPNRGSVDMWLVKVNANGLRIWDQSYGGSGLDVLTTVEPAGDGGFLLGGYSDSGASGNKTSPGYGGTDAWLVKVDANGNKLWDATFGGTGSDTLSSITPTRDGGWLLAISSNSPVSGNKTLTGFGGGDIWLVKLAGPAPPLAIEPLAGAGIRLAWPLTAAGWVLETTETPGLPANWSPIPPPYETDVNNIFLTVPMTSERRFFRLRKP